MAAEICISEQGLYSRGHVTWATVFNDVNDELCSWRSTANGRQRGMASLIEDVTFTEYPFHKFKYFEVIHSLQDTSLKQHQPSDYLLSLGCAVAQGKPFIQKPITITLFDETTTRLVTAPQGSDILCFDETHLVPQAGSICADDHGLWLPTPCVWGKEQPYDVIFSPDTREGKELVRSLLSQCYEMYRTHQASATPMMCPPVVAV